MPANPAAATAETLSEVEVTTPAEAKEMLSLLMGDREWGAAVLRDPKSPQAVQMDHLQRMSLGMPPAEPPARGVNDRTQEPRQPQAVPEPKPAPLTGEAAALAALEPPATPADYRIEPRDPVTGMVMKLDADTQALVDETLLPTAHRLGLSQADLIMAQMSVARPMDEVQCEQYLRRVWKGDYEARLNDFRAAVSNPADRKLIEDYPDTLGNNGPLIAAIVSAHRRRAK